MREQLRRGHPDYRDLKEVANELWADPSVIENYIDDCWAEYELSEDDRTILKDWLHPFTATFVLERHLSDGSIFIDPDTEQVYLVKGLTNPWYEMSNGQLPPFALEATLLAFKKCIISDGLVSLHSISFGSNYRESFRKVYTDAKRNHSIHTSL